MKLSNRDIIMIAAAAALLVSTIVLGYFVFKEEKQTDSDLRVDDVYFVMEAADEERSQIKIVVFISNIGNKDVEKLQIRAFTVETGSNLAMDDSSTTINDVEQKTTVEGNLIVDVPNNESYRMELLIFKDDKLEIRGSGTIDLADVGASYDYRTYPGYDDDDAMYADSPSEDAAISWFGGACVMLIIAGVVIGIIVYAAVKTGKKDEDQKEQFFREGPPPMPRHLRRIEPRLEEFEDKAMEEQLLEREAKRHKKMEKSRAEKFAPPLKEEKKDKKETADE
jgi:hypothetical protein